MAEHNLFLTKQPCRRVAVVCLVDAASDPTQRSESRVVIVARRARTLTFCFSKMLERVPLAVTRELFNDPSIGGETIWVIWRIVCKNKNVRRIECFDTSFVFSVAYKTIFYRLQS